MTRALELRREQDGKTATISGLASRYGTWYKVFDPARGQFEERIAAGAATASLRSSPDVLFTSEHNRSRAVARTPQTLTLRETAEGLHYRAVVDLADPDARSVVSKIEAGVFVESSFGFRVPPSGDSWSDDYTKRTVYSVDLHRGDVSAVPFGASPSTNVIVERALRGSLEERRALAERISRSGWCGPALVLRDDAQGTLLPTTTIEDDEVECPRCGGSGLLADGSKCPLCDGEGTIDADEPDADDQRRDYDNAVRALNRTPTKNREIVKRYLVRRARQEGWPIPSSWNAKRSAVLLPNNDSDSLRLELAMMDSRMLRTG